MMPFPTPQASQGQETRRSDGPVSTQRETQKELGADWTRQKGQKGGDHGGVGVRGRLIVVGPSPKRPD